MHLVLSLVPPPQVTEQEVHELQGSTSQSTEEKSKTSLNENLPGILQATLQLRVSAISMILVFAHFSPLPTASEIFSL